VAEMTPKEFKPPYHALLELLAPQRSSNSYPKKLNPTHYKYLFFKKGCKKLKFFVFAHARPKECNMMNRPERRRHGIRGNRQPLHYSLRLMAANAAFPLPRGEVSQAMIHHEAWCQIYKGGPCSCVPDISIHCPGRKVIEVDPWGNAKEVESS